MAAIPIVAFVALWGYANTLGLRTPNSAREPIAFTREGWQESQHDWTGSRGLMIGEPIAKHPLVGMARPGVIDLVGPFHPGDYPGVRGPLESDSEHDAAQPAPARPARVWTLGRQHAAR